METQKFLMNLIADRITAVAPTIRISIPSLQDPRTWLIDFRPEATPAQRQAAQDVIVNFDIVIEEQKLKEIENAKVGKKASLLAKPNKSVTVQDLLDLGLI